MLEKFNIYDLLTKITTGALLLGVLILQYLPLIKPLILELKIVPDPILIVIAFSLIYFLGFVVNRLSSIATERFLECLKFVNIRDYPTFVKAEKVYPRLTTLSQEYAVSRTYATLCLVLLGLFLLSLCSINLSYKIIAPVIIVLLSWLFACSAKKHSDKINKIVRDYKE